jgi:hypothetical protein
MVWFRGMNNISDTTKHRQAKLITFRVVPIMRVDIAGLVNRATCASGFKILVSLKSVKIKLKVRINIYLLIHLLLRMVCNKQMPYRLCLLTLL